MNALSPLSHKTTESVGAKKVDAGAGAGVEGRAPTEEESNKMSQYGSYYGGSGGSASGGGPGRSAYYGASGYNEPGSRRKKLAALAGSVYRAGAAAASEIKEQYNNTRIRNLEPWDNDQISIPGSFPQVAIVTKGEEQMVLFPSYAKEHIREYDEQGRPRAASVDPMSQQQQYQQQQQQQQDMSEEDYWRHEWSKMEDEKAVVDVDVRGWIYMPSRGPMTRRNRMLIGLARRLSGVPPPTTAQSEQNTPASRHEEHERMREEQRIAKEARDIERRGREEKEAANRGEYSEQPTNGDDGFDSETDDYGIPRSGNRTPPSPKVAPRQTFSQPVPEALTEAELAVANANLMARIGPFMTTPLVQLPITIFFYNEVQSQSRTVTTNDSGHFSIRAALDFVPTHIRVLANENISATEEVQVIQPQGVSLISDIDDTIKRSNISLGAREIFRNTFIRDLSDLTVEGVGEWYNSLHKMGVQIHYCSNSPWQLFPVLATFFYKAGLPPGSIHLKHYSGMLQGIFEPVAERKRGTLERILRDFPERRFLLVGDSGEADLEVYTELVLAHPGRILAVFIRDVTTPEQAGYFDSPFGAASGTAAAQNGPNGVRNTATLPIRSNNGGGSMNVGPIPPSRKQLPPSSNSGNGGGPVMGTLIDFSDDTEQTMTASPSGISTHTQSVSREENTVHASKSAVDLLSGKKPPPPRPVKPMALRSAPSELRSSSDPMLTTAKASGSVSSSGSERPPNTNARAGSSSSPRPLAHATTFPTVSSTGNGTMVSSNGSKQEILPPPPPPPRRRTGGSGLSSNNSGTSIDDNSNGFSQKQQVQQRRGTGGDNNGGGGGAEWKPQPQPPTAAFPGYTATTTINAGMAEQQQLEPSLNKKLDLWRRRLARAHEILDEAGVPLYTWRRGDDVIREAEGIVKDAMKRQQGQGQGQTKAKGR